MSEALVKKMFKHDASIKDLLEIERYIAPLYQGFMMPRGMAGVPFFISKPIGMYYDKKTGLFLTKNSIASYIGKLNGRINLDVKYINGVNKDAMFNMKGSMNSESKMIDGRIIFDRLQDDYYGFYILPLFDEKMFYEFLKRNLH